MSQSISKIGIVVGMDTAGLAAGARSSESILTSFKSRADSIGGGGHGAESFGQQMFHAFHGAHVSLTAMEGSLVGMGKLAMNLSVAGLGIAAGFEAAKFAAEGIGKAVELDPAAMKLWTTFKSEIADLALIIGKELLPWIKLWLESGIALIQAIKGGAAVEPIQTYKTPQEEHLAIPALKADAMILYNGLRMSNAEAGKLLKQEKEMTAEFEKQGQIINDTIRKKNQAFVDMGKRITEEMRTPGEILNQKVGELNFLANRGLITFETYSRAINKAADDFAGLGAKAKQFQQLTNSENAALDRFSTAGYSATHEAADRWAQIQAINQQQLAEERLANQKRDQILKVLKDGGLKVKQVTF